MRERTPSADDTPKRAPPAPPRVHRVHFAKKPFRLEYAANHLGDPFELTLSVESFRSPEAASADAAGSKTSSETAEIFRAGKFSPSATASTTAASSPSSVDARMVASTHSLDDLGASHPASASGDRQQQEKHGHTYRSAQTAQDKRSRLSNVINNLRKKVPDSRSGDSPRKEEDDRNSVERNLETLEKYVMTVLNGVIKDEEEDDLEVGRSKEAEKGKDSEKLREDQEDEDSKGPAAKFEPSKPNESRTEAAVFLSEQPEKAESLLASVTGKECSEQQQKLDDRVEDSLQEGSESLGPRAESCEAVEDEGKGSSKEAKLEEQRGEERSESHEEEKKESRSLGTIIMERLSDHQSEDKGNADVGREEVREFVSDNAELRNVCRDLLNDLLNGINQLIDEKSQEKEERALDSSAEEARDSRSQDLSTTSLHCSLPLDKVASVLQNCQAPEFTVPQSPSSPSSSSSSSQGSKSPCKPPSPTVRHLCLYCDRKFLSISLRQRHTERVHQQGGGRRSERNSRRPSQNCQYCSDKCAESLEGLFQHMVGSHGDKYHACVQCSTRYLTREALAGHMSENHAASAERNLQVQEKLKEPAACKDLGSSSPRDKAEPPSPKDRRPPEDLDHEHRAEPILLKPPIVPSKDNFSNPGSPEFDSSFYSSVSCNIRENLLHHLDGKLQSSSSTVAPTAVAVPDAKPQQQPQQQIQFPIDISLTAATPVYSKEYPAEEYENSSEYAQKPGKSNRSHPRRVSFEKYNFPRKYDGKEQWTCSIKDLSKFDISTQLSLRKKQQLLKECVTLNRLHQVPILPSETTDVAQDEQSLASRKLEETGNLEGAPPARSNAEADQTPRRDGMKAKEAKLDVCEVKFSQATEFSTEFCSFLRLRKWDEKTSNEAAKKQEVVYAELTGEWSRPRVYICGACASKHVTLREMEDHKAAFHPNVWCSHFEFSGDQRELYKHLFLPGKDVPTAKAKTAILVEKVCTKCSRNCSTLPELHRHMLECGGDQAWLLGLFGNGKKKCKWRPFGSRSRRRRQRGMKRNIQNSQTPRVNTPKEKQPTGPRVRPSDRESIQKMLANLPPKRATRKVMQDSTLRAQGRLRSVQTRSRPRMVGDISTASRMSRNKAALRNKLLKNAKSIQRHRCRIDNISAVIESVVSSCIAEEKPLSEKSGEDGRRDVEKDAKERTAEGAKVASEVEERSGRVKLTRGPRVLGKKRNVKTKEAAIRAMDHARRAGWKARAKSVPKNSSEVRPEGAEGVTPKSLKVKTTEREADSAKAGPSPPESKSPSPSGKNKFAQSTPKRKRPVDPVASLNASIKAKSQLRTQDGKFARNPNKDSPQKSPEVRPTSARQLAKGKGEGSPEWSITRSKLRAVSRGKTGEQPKRTSRLSSDSDKMPTLEPAVSSNSEEFAEASANDLPILSPATPSSSSEKLRGKNVVPRSLEDKESPKKSEETEGAEGDLQEEEKKQGKTRRGKSEAKNPESTVPKRETSKERPKDAAKEKLKSKNARARMLNAKKKMQSAWNVLGDAYWKEDVRQKKREPVKTLPKTRSKSKMKLESMLDSDGQINMQNVPFEVKKLIGPDNKEELLTQVVLTAGAATSKRCLRQAVPKVNKSLSDVSGKKEDRRRRKSLRNTEKKLEKDKAASKDEKLVSEEGVKVRGRRSNSLPGETKSVAGASQATLSEGHSKTEIGSAAQSTDSEATGSKRQTRGSALSNEVDAQSKETSELNDMSLKKNTSLGKRRGRIKSSNELPEKSNTEVSPAKNNEEADKSGPADKASSVEEKEERSLLEDNNGVVKEQEEAKVEQPQGNETENVKLSLNHLQLETSSSIDSGKENSLETVVGPQKLRVGRPRKSWGSRRERTSKRSLNNVIGILTEGMNIPVESQQSVVLTVQTALDSVNPEAALQNSSQQSGEAGSRPLSLDRADKSSETASSADDLAEGARPCVQNPEESRQTPEASAKDLGDSLAMSQQVDSPSSDVKEQSPANDIILDLSRRKQKGKGSFLEKIVSKIAKQKDALLEGEVGSLLDTAADELTSILDEVGPGLSEAAENSAENGGSRAKTEKVQGGGQEAEGKSRILEDSPSTSDTSEQSVEAKDIKVNDIQAAESGGKENGLKEEEITGDSTEQEEAKIESTCLAGEEVIDQHPEDFEAHKEAGSDDLELEDQAPMETDPAPNGILLPINQSVSESTLKSPAKQEAVEDSKFRRKSKKRSLEGNSPKKSKRKSIEPAEDSEESLIPEELHLADIMKLIEKSKQVPSTKENIEDGSSMTTVQPVQPGKKKTTDNPKAKESSSSKVTDNVQTTEDSTDGVGIKMDAAEGVEGIGEDKLRKTSDEVQRNNEEKNSSPLRARGKRKSSVEPVEQQPQIESLVRRSSKRRSLPEERVAQASEEETDSPLKETTPETSRRRSSRTRTMAQSKNEERTQKDAESDLVLNFNNSITIEDSELQLKSSEKDEPSEHDASPVQTTILPTTEATNAVQETSPSISVERQGADKEGVAEDVAERALKESQKVTDPPKVPKKRGRKKKSPTEQAQVTSDLPKENSESKMEAQSVKTASVTLDETPSRRSLRGGRANEDAEEPSKDLNNVVNSQIPSPSLEHFKIPEVTEVLQHTKKRTSKRKSTTEDHSDAQSNLPTDSEANNAESPEVRSLGEREEQAESRDQKDSSESRKRSSRSSNRDRLDLERSSSSGSIDLASRTRSLKRKQLSSEDLADQEGLNRRAESVDSLSETSCVSESSYFRKKRFSKKKKGYQEPSEDVQTDTSVTDSESLDAERNGDRRQSLKRRAKKNISLCEDQFYLVDGFDIPMDIEECLRQEDASKDLDQEAEPKATTAEEKVADESAKDTSNTENVEKPAEKPAEEPAEKEDAEESAKSLGEDEEEAKDAEVEKGEGGEEKVDAEAPSQAPEDFQAPKKRAAGNYVVVHKKTGEILIVEKRKKLTKEAARFFCDVCATSFTRKSSLKKHNLSQSHLLQLAKSKKDKVPNESTEEASDASWKNETSSQQESFSEENKSVVDDSVNVAEESKEDQKDFESSSNDLEAAESDSSRRTSVEQEALIPPEATQQHMLEDQLLDEEICKITENMSHDEYVLTEHTSPIPESTSTPIKLEIKKAEEVPKKKKHEKKKEKAKKKSLAEEHLTLDTPEPEPPLEPTPGTLLAVLGSNISIKISKSSHLNTSEPPVTQTDISERIKTAADSSEPRSDIAVLKEDSFQGLHSDNTDASKLGNSQDLDSDVERLRRTAEQVKEHSMEVEENIGKNAEEVSEAISNDKVGSKESQPHERLSLKLTISKRSLECSAEADTVVNRSPSFDRSAGTEDVVILDHYTNQRSVEMESIEDTNRLKLKVDRVGADLESDLSNSLKGSRSLDAVEDVNVSKRVLEVAHIVENLEDVKIDQVLSSSLVTENKIGETATEQREAAKATRHGKSKKSKAKKHVEEEENLSAETLTTRRTSKLKGNRQSLDEAVRLADSLGSAECYESLEGRVISKTSNETEFLERNSDEVNNVVSLAENEAEYKSDVPEEKLYPDLETEEEASLKEAAEEKEGNIDSEVKIGSLHPAEEDEDSSSSSLADKPLSQILLRADEKLEAERKQEKERASTLDSVPVPEERKTEEKLGAEDASSSGKFEAEEPSTVDDHQFDNKELMNRERVEPPLASEEECEPETPRSAEDSEKEAKVSSESENSEAIAQVKSVPGAKIASGDRKSSAKRVSKSHRYSGKDSHRRSRSKKASLKAKIAELTSESEDSENQDKIESRNKNKIVKSVFGRVFGGEKVDKVKEVLNDWVSKSEEDSDTSRTGFASSSPNESGAREGLDIRSEERNAKTPSSPKKRSGKKSRKSSSSDRAREKNPEAEEEHRPGKHAKPKNSSSNRKKNDIEAADYYYLVLPPTSCRSSKKRAEERISRAFKLFDDLYESNNGEKSSKQKEVNYELRNQSKPDLTIKDSGYGSFNCDETPAKLAPLEDSAEEVEQVAKRRKSSASRRSKSKKGICAFDDEDWGDVAAGKGASEDEEDSSVKGLPEEGANRLSVDLESSRSCCSLAPSSVRNRSPSMDRNSQTTRDSEVHNEDRDEEEMDHRRISPLFACGTPRSSVDSSSNSENEEEQVAANEARKRSSSEFSGEKVVIRSPSSTHKTEVVTIAPTDAIEDNALDVPQEIEAAKPRQGKVLNFDEELFVECCSRLKATTENELRGAKKIKLDHSEGYHRKDELQQGFRGPRDRWRDVESQNSLGSLLESVNQLLGEEMYSTKERDYPKRGSRNLRSEHSSRSASPDMSRADNLGYEDSLDVAFEHNNKLRDKIQQRMRESESLIASTFGQKSSNEIAEEHPPKNDEQEVHRNSYGHSQDQGQLPGANLSNGSYNNGLHVRDLQEQTAGKINVDSSGFKSKMNSALGGLLDKALSNLLHSNGKHDHNGSTPMKVLAELACARAPTSTTGDSTSQEEVQPAKPSVHKAPIPAPSPLAIARDLQKKARNPIKELFERKKEMNERKQQEKSKTEAALRELNVHRQRKTKKTKKHQDFPLIRRGEHGGLVERKKRRDGFERKEEFASGRIKDVYDFDEEESQMEPNLGSVMSYRSRPGYEVSCLRTKEVDVAGLMSKAIGESLENGKTADALSTRLESMIDRKFKELEKFAPKTKGALKSFQSEEQQQSVTGPMDEFVERKQPKRPQEPSMKHSKLKKRSKNPKKKARNAWYENDSSDEYRTAVKAEDVGVGISKSQRTCSKGKQNIFAELYTSSESEFEDEGVDYEAKRQRKVKKAAKKLPELEQSEELVGKYCSENEDQVDDWGDRDLKGEANKNDCDNKKSESEMSDHPLVIDERKDADDQRNSDEETETQYERNFELDDLYREDTSVADSDAEEPTITEAQSVPEGSRVGSPSLPREKMDGKAEYMQEDELIPLEEALDLLDQADTNLGSKYDTVHREPKGLEHIETVEAAEPVNETFDSAEEPAEKCPSPAEDQEEEPDNDLLALPEKLSTNEKPQKESDNLPLHVFLSRKVQESKKRKEQQLKKMQEEQERILMDFQPTRRQRKCAIGKQGLLAEISSSDEEASPRDSRRSNDRSDHEKPRKQKRESKEKRKERYIEKKHEQMIAKEQKAIEEEILRELGKIKETLAQTTVDAKVDSTREPESTESQEKAAQEQAQRKKHQLKEKQKKLKAEEDNCVKSNSEGASDLENNCGKSAELESNHEGENHLESPAKLKRHPKSPMKPKKPAKGEAKPVAASKKGKNPPSDKSRNRTDSKSSRDKERRSSSSKRDSDDEELKTTKSWNKVEEGVGVAIGRRKRAAANQLYYWSSSSDEEEMLEVVPAVEEEEDDRQEQHGWIVGDSHKRMITMLAMEKQLKEKRRRSEDEFEPGKAKSKKHRNSTS
ncbi:uncharacterized protein LOC143377101 isoform X3 [Andrena cerasifolii]|uniref:uncharacterized protein LOC143377101 isoform X3 n=1 Tax=Andrena cerasifolii TaxID=2819439 RepID=UPI0040380DD1